MKVVLNDGRVLTWEEREGDSTYHLTWDAAVQMAHQLCDEVSVPPSMAAALIDRVARVDELADLRARVAVVCDATRAP